jgi:deoxyribodipyrimidine photo-lyase
MCRSLEKLGEELARHGSTLQVHEGPVEKNLLDLCKKHKIAKVCWNRLYEPEALELDERLTKKLEAIGVICKVFDGNVLNRPSAVLKGDGTPYRVYTPYWRAVVKREVDPIVPKPRKLPPAPAGKHHSLAKLGLLPNHDWYKKIEPYWQVGETAAHRRLKSFVNDAVSDYTRGRDIPSIDGTSKLSPHLHFGEIGPRTVWHHVANLSEGSNEQYLKELVWREFAVQLLTHFPHTVTKPLNESFKNFPWRSDASGLRAWQQGRTGFPIVDAGMRQLWEAGWMHNRVRMIVASFLVKHLLIHWHEGAAWFADTLVDADLASNTMGWQWSAGSGADAAPYFRIFNPYLQSQKFDPKGEYIREWVPELRKLNDKQIHLGDADGYPKPIVDHKLGRERALSAYKSMRSQ